MSEEARLRFKLSKKLKLANEKSKYPSEGNKKFQSRPDKSARRNVKDEGESDGKGKFNSLNSDRRKKRIYADQDTDGEETLCDRKALSKKVRNKVKDGSVKQKINEKSIRTIWDSSRIDKATSEIKRSSGKPKNANNVKEKFNEKSIRTTRDSISIDNAYETKRSFGKPKNAVERAQVFTGKVRTNAKEVDKMDGGENGSLKKRIISKYDSSKRLDQSQNKLPHVFPSNSSKKAAWDKKGLDDNSQVLDDQPKKRKWGIRIDPYDISNKRLDDGVVINESTKETKKEQEKDDEISKNAQFRAIQPSPSILSFVEDNLLGRRRMIELRRAGYNIDLSAPLDNIPFSTSSERERIEENIFRNKLEFFAAAKVSSSFPDPDLPEIAFAGRSNVGKSSLLNSLTRQWGVVRTSDKPGHTQTINFFNLGSKLCLVDLPGYGFAYAKEEVKDAWEELVKEYVSTRVGLKRVCLLIDTKWGMKPRDHELIALMERSNSYETRSLVTRYQIVLTKTDTVFPIDVARRGMQIEESLKANKSVVQPLMMVSSKSGAGIGSLRTVLTKIARFAKV